MVTSYIVVFIWKQFPLQMPHVGKKNTFYIAAILPVAIRCAPVREEEHHLVCCHRHQGYKIPKHVRVLNSEKRVKTQKISMNKLLRESVVGDLKP